MAVQVDPEDATANMLMGMLLKDGLDFKTALIYLRKAYSKRTNDVLIMTNMASLLSRSGVEYIEEAMTIARKIVRLTNSPQSHYSLGDIIGPYQRMSEEGIRGKLTGMALAVDRVPKTSGLATCAKWTLRTSWLQCLNVSIEMINFPDFDQFGTNAPRMLNVVDLDTPLTFTDKETMAITVDNVTLEGPAAIAYTDCEVIAIMGISTDLPRFFTGIITKFITIDKPIVSLLHHLLGNYYHMTVEILTR